MLTMPFFHKLLSDTIYYSYLFPSLQPHGFLFSLPSVSGTVLSQSLRTASLSAKVSAGLISSPLLGVCASISGSSQATLSKSPVFLTFPVPNPCFILHHRIYHQTISYVFSLWLVPIIPMGCRLHENSICTLCSLLPTALCT